jgi:hypothetical protein
MHAKYLPVQTAQRINQPLPAYPVLTGDSPRPLSLELLQSMITIPVNLEINANNLL